MPSCLAEKLISKQAHCRILDGNFRAHSGTVEPRLCR